MDSTAQDPKTQQQNPVSTPDPSSTQAGTPAPSSQPQNQPVSKPAGVKEGAPALTQEWVSPSMPEVVLPKEVKDAGIEETPLVPPLPQDSQQMGVRFAKEATPVEIKGPTPLGMATPHISIQAMMKIHKNVKNGVTWLLRLINRQQEIQEKSQQKGGV